MRRRPLTQAELLARMPRTFRPKLATDQLRDLGLAHVVNLDAIARGEGDETLLWHWVEAALLWSRVAELLTTGVPEMQLQRELADRLVERYGRTGMVGFSGPDYQLAKDGLQVMEQLAELVDRPTAIAAAEWSERRVGEMVAACKAREAAAA